MIILFGILYIPVTFAIELYCITACFYESNYDCYHWYFRTQSISSDIKESNDLQHICTGSMIAHKSEGQ